MIILTLFLSSPDTRQAPSDGYCSTVSPEQSKLVPMFNLHWSNSLYTRQEGGWPDPSELQGRTKHVVGFLGSENWRDAQQEYEANLSCYRGLVLLLPSVAYGKGCA